MGWSELYAELCVACAQRCACDDHCAVCSGWYCAGRRAGVRGLCVCILHVSVRCALRALVGMCAAALGLRKCEESCVRRTRDVRCTHCWRCLERSDAGAVPQYCDCGFVLPCVRRCAALRCGCCVTAQRCVRLCSRLIVRICASRCAACTRALPPRCIGGAVLRVCCRWRRRRRSLAVHVAH